MCEKRFKVGFADLMLEVDSLQQFFANAVAANYHLATAKVKSLNILENKFEIIRKDINDFNIAQDSVEKHFDFGKEIIDFLDQVSAIRGKYFKLKETYENSVTTKPANGTNPTSNTSLIGLKDIPVFAGSLEEFPNFKYIFDSVVNITNDELQKLIVLKNKLSGEALELVNSLDNVSTNYKVAWDTLNDHYSCKRVAHLRLLDQMINFQKLFPNASAEKFINVFKSSINNIKKLKLKDELEFLYYQIAYVAMSKAQKTAFDIAVSNSEPSIQDIYTFLENKARSEQITRALSYSCQEKFKNHYVSKGRNALECDKAFFNYDGVQGDSNALCRLCNNNNHKIYHCTEFKKLNPRERTNLIKEWNHCVNCLKQYHTSEQERNNCFKNKCKLCNKPHNSLLHWGNDNNRVNFTNRGQLEDEHSDNDSHTNINVSDRPVALTNHDSGTEVLLGTVLGKVKDRYGKYHKIRIVIDTGSQLDLITEECAKKLDLEIYKNKNFIIGINERSTRPCGSVDLDVESCTGPGVRIHVRATVIPNITGSLPSANLPSHIYNNVRNYDLADPNFDKKGRIDVLFGAATFFEVLSMDSRPFIKGNPSLYKTTFGVVVSGRLDGIKQTKYLRSHVTINQVLDNSVQRFWMQESLTDVIKEDPEHVKCENLYKSTTVRNKGRYSVSFPFKPTIQELETNIKAAYSSFLYMEKRLSRNQYARESYHKFLNEFAELKHMEVAVKKSRYILPQTCVFNNKSSTTKVRVCFNGSACDKNRFSLNEAMYVGPNLQKTIPEILFHFRLHNIALVADIQMCYRMIEINPEHRAYQHIYYRKTEAEELQEYEVSRLLYGLRSSAYLCQRTIMQLAQDEQSKYPAASDVLMNDMYADNLISGADTALKAKALSKELISIFKSAGMVLRKFSSNDDSVLKDLQRDQLEQPICFENSEGVKVLGLLYEFKNDYFTFIGNNFEGKVTRRNMLSYISKVFDPLGLIAPVTFFGKFLLQKTYCLDKAYGWDQELPTNLKDEWLEFTGKFSSINSVKIPRKIISNYVEFNICAFSDASEKGYAAVVYGQCIYDGNINTCLLQSKTHVAPIKFTTIPKMELNGALLLSKLVNSIIDYSKVKFNNIFLFTDSKIVLHWIHTEIHLLQVFVANRVDVINEITKDFIWSYIESKQNPADLASKGLHPDKIISNRFWFTGPEFISTHHRQWKLETIVNIETVEGFRSIPKVLISVKEPEPDYILTVFNSFSSYFRLKRVVAYLLRFITNCKEKIKENRQLSRLSYKEITTAANVIVIKYQYYYFRDEMKDIKKGVCPKQLSTLNPFIDQYGIIRVGGRLSNSRLCYNNKHPVLLPKNCHLSRIVISHFHVSNLHSGPSLTKVLIRRKFWIISSHYLIKKLIRTECFRCLRFSGKIHQPIMADLIPERVTPSRPFQSISMDFAGHFPVRSSTLRKAPTQKGYFCVFLCLAVRAIHIEFVSELSTAAFTAAFHRFVSRRGLPNVVFSDQGSNFIGAQNEVKEAIAFFRKNHNEILSPFEYIDVKFKHPPAYASSMSGNIEIQVKMIKSLLYKQFKEKPLTFEKYTTILTRIEAIINQRPLGPISEDEHYDYLTPAHFLLGYSLESLPEKPVGEKESLKNRWKYLSHQIQIFWKRWSTEYLNIITQRNKWKIKTYNPMVGQLVYVTDMHTSPLQYPIGRITELHPGKDGTIRVVSLRIGRKTITRAVNKLILFNPELE